MARNLYTADRLALHLIQRGAAVTVTTAHDGKTLVAATRGDRHVIAAFKPGRQGRFAYGLTGAATDLWAGRLGTLKSVVDALDLTPTAPARQLPVIVVVPFTAPECETAGMYPYCFTDEAALGRWHSGHGDLDPDPCESGWALTENHTWN